MPKVSTHFAGKLASEQTGLNSLDKSGVVIADAFAQSAGKIYNMIDTEVTKQKNLLQQSELTKTLSQYDSDLAVATADIRQKNLSSPEEAVKQLDVKRKELFEQYKGTITDPEVKIRFDAAGSESSIKYGALDRIWAFQENNKIVQKNYLDTANENARFLNKTDDIQKLFDKSYIVEGGKEGIYQAWGGFSEGEQFIKQANTANFHAYFLGQLGKGNAFAALEQLKDPRLATMVGEPAVAKMRKQALQVADADKENAAAYTLATTVGVNGKLIDDVMNHRVSLSDISEQANELSFNIANTKAKVAAGQANQKEVDVLVGQQRVLELAQEATLTRDANFIVPNDEVTADFAARFGTLFKAKQGKRISMVGTLEEVFQFQKDIMENRQQLDPKDASKWLRVSEVAFQDQVDGVASKKSKYGTEKSWFGLGPEVLKDQNKLSSSQKLRDSMAQVLAKTDATKGRQFQYDTLRFFIDELDDRGDIKNPSFLGSMNQETLNAIAKGAQQKAQLKALGLPVHLKIKDPVSINGRNYAITGFDDDGMPTVEVGQ